MLYKVAVHRSSSGGVIVNLLLLLAVSGAIYLIWALLPAYTDNMTARQQLQLVANDAWRRVGKDEIQKRVLQKLSEIGNHIEVQPGALPTEVRGLPVAEDDVVVTCTDRGADCSGSDGNIEITVNYARVMSLPYLTGKSITLHFSPHVKETLQPVTW